MSLNIALIGCGRISEESHLPAILKSNQVRLAALVDAQVARAERLVRKYGCECEVRSTFEAVRSPLDGVLIATPNNTHAPLARRALERGVAVLVEKPLTPTYAEAVELCELADEKGTFVSVGFFTRHYPVVALFKRLLGERFFGEPRHFHFEYGTRGGWAPVSGYNLSRDQAGGGVLVVSGTHYIDRMLYWFGEPEGFEYADDSYGGVEANCKVSLRYAGGLTGSLFFSKTIALRNQFVLETDRCRVEVPTSETQQLHMFLHSTPGVAMAVSGTGAVSEDFFQAQIDEFASAIRHRTAVAVDGRAGAASVKLCEAFYSARVQLDEPWAWYRQPVRAPAAS